MWSCEKEAALQDFEAVPEEMEIAARKAPPGGAAPTPPCSGCRLTITSLPSGRSIEVRSFESFGQSSYIPAYVCNGDDLWLSGTAHAANLPVTIEFATSDLVDYQKFRFAARTSGATINNVDYTISCSGSSTFGNVNEHNSISGTAWARGHNMWSFKFPGTNPSGLGSNNYYDCVLASVCEEEPLEP